MNYDGYLYATRFYGDGSNLTGLPGGGGDFSTKINGGIGYAVTTSLGTAFTAPSTAGITYIVRSVHITNIGTASADITADFSGTNYSSIAFAHTVPVPVGSSVELLKKPKIMNPSDLLRLQSSLTTTLHAFIAYEIQSDTKFFGRGVDVTSSATYVDLVTMTANGVVESVLLSNDDGVNDLKSRVVWTDGSNAIQGYLAYDLIVPADATVEVLEQPKYLPSGHKIRVYSNVADRLEAIVAGKTV